MKRRSLLCAAASAMPAAWAGTSSLESLRWLPEDRIDVGRASFALSQEFYPSVDIDNFSRQLDAMAAAVRRKVTSPNDPEERVWAMNTVFFQERGIRYDHDPQGRQKPLNYLLHGLLETGKGMCLSMTLLYVAVGQRLGYPIALVCVPDSKLTSGSESSSYALQAKATMRKAIDLGYVRIEDVQRGKSIKGMVGR